MLVRGKKGLSEYRLQLYFFRNLRGRPLLTVKTKNTALRVLNLASLFKAISYVHKPLSPTCDYCVLDSMSKDHPCILCLLPQIHMKRGKPHAQVHKRAIPSVRSQTLQTEGTQVREEVKSSCCLTDSRTPPKLHLKSS